jgi:predicted patatin/cPLA2 family phospholipase
MQLPGICPNTAVKNIIRRRTERLEGQRTPTTMKSALVIQGGGMRGVFSAGCLVALAELGYTQGFDEVYATSSGAINGAFFLADAMAFGATIYYEEINNARFINPFRVTKIMDLDWMFDEVLTARKPLDVHRVCSNDVPLYITCFDIDTATLRLFSSQEDPLSLMHILKASTAIPILYNRSVAVSEGRFMDGSCS